ncbi:kinase-like protein [Macrolepiota fuliginosa MF-IS2]|uniref:Kinase-like protein n=1 Tax=Macrolepiota fuliginosa MF-IS2 TaxID=1400762 RepID=A0A9P6C265_9AGAR|nr:kinase-like protein [Macrolepiota fuliginosa MF-IS2]
MTRLYVQYALGQGSLIATSEEQTQQVLERLSNIIYTPLKRIALLKLRDSRAQMMIDWLSLVLQLDISDPWLRKNAKLTLFELCTVAAINPKCYFLNDVAVGSEPATEGFSGIHNGHLGGSSICVKVVHVFQHASDAVYPRDDIREIIGWGQLHHPNIVPLYGIFHSKLSPLASMVSPWMHNGNLEKYLIKHPDEPRPPLIFDISLGLQYLHEQGVIHGNVKGANVLVNDIGRACIADFGFYVLQVGRTITHTREVEMGYTIPWASPERIQGGSSADSTFMSDIWSFGCVCFEVLTGLMPFHKCSERIAIRSLLEGELPSGSDPAKVLAGIDDYLCDLMNSCWRRNPDDRPSCQEIVEILKSNGVTREPIEEDQEAKRFRENMRERATMSESDLAQVEGILRQLEAI